LKEYDVFGIGTALVDYFAKCTDEFLTKNSLTKGATNFFPREKLDELHSRISDSIFLQLPGDNARNVCEGVSYLGGKSAYASAFADDPEGAFFERSLAANEIESYLVKKPGRTGKIIALVTRDGQRTFAVDLGNSMDFDALPTEGIKNSSYLYLTSITLLAAGNIGMVARDAIELAEQSGVKFVLSLESPPMIAENKARLRRVVERADVLLANEEELAALDDSPADDCARSLVEGVEVVCLKKGEKGSRIFIKNREFSVPAYSTKVVDTTGAGDFYTSGVIFGLSRGKSAEEAGHLGAKLAGNVVGYFGATARGDRGTP
jgi:sugar/nucleoside kinase (ribokinase family)